MRIKTVELDTLQLDDKNARKHSERNLSAIKESLSRFGQRKPIAVRGSRVLAGNGTLQAAQSLGWTHIDVVEVPEEWDDDTAKAYALADNRTAELAEWDEGELAKQLLQLEEAEWDIEALGFELPKLLDIPADVDDIPEIPKEPISKGGDLWQIGRHKILCADSTMKENYARLMENNQPKIVFADPPYGIAYKAMRGGKEIANDGDAKSALEVIPKALIHAVGAESWFVCCDWRSLSTICVSLEEIKIQPKACIIWDKMSRVQNLDKYAKQHEFIVYAGPYGGQKTVATDIWPHKRDFNPDHPTPKPISLVAQAIETSSVSGDIVYDPFAGSGSTLVAAETTGRIGYGIELDPGYVDVIVQRLENITGQKATLVSSK